MSDWQPIETAPRDGRTVLVFGKPDNLIFDGNLLVTFNVASSHTAHWDHIDEAFCLSGGSWLGPFVEPTHWMPLPDPPEDAA